QAAAAAGQCREAERHATALLDRREELRGLLDAYQARAARLGGAEDGDLDARYARARELLWTAPCDLAAATAAVTGYQQAVLALGERGKRAGPAGPGACGPAAAGPSTAGTATPAAWPRTPWRPRRPPRVPPLPRLPRVLRLLRASRPARPSAPGPAA